MSNPWNVLLVLLMIVALWLIAKAAWTLLTVWWVRFSGRNTACGQRRRMVEDAQSPNANKRYHAIEMWHNDKVVQLLADGFIDNPDGNGGHKPTFTIERLVGPHVVMEQFHSMCGTLHGLKGRALRVCNLSTQERRVYHQPLIATRSIQVQSRDMQITERICVAYDHSTQLPAGGHHAKRPVT